MAKDISDNDSSDESNDATDSDEGGIEGMGCDDVDIEVQFEGTTLVLDY